MGQPYERCETDSGPLTATKKRIKTSIHQRKLLGGSLAAG